MKIPFWPEQLTRGKPSNTAIFAKVFLGIITLPLLPTLLVMIRFSDWMATGILVVCMILVTSGVVGMPRRYYVFGVALINVLVALSVWGTRPGLNVQTAFVVLAILFIAGLYGLIWWVAAEPIWCWRAQQPDEALPFPPLDETLMPLPPARFQVEVVAARILLTIFTLSLSVLVVAMAWFFSELGETLGMSESEAVWFVAIVLPYPLFLWITGYFRLPKLFRVIVLWFHILLTMGIAGWLFWLTWKSEMSGVGLAAGGTICSGLYALIWWVATQPKARTPPPLPQPTPG